MSFVFSNFLASFPLFFIFCGCPLFPSPRSHSALVGAASRPRARLQQTLDGKTTIVGYHRSTGLSSSKCKKATGLSRGRLAGADGGSAMGGASVAEDRRAWRQPRSSRAAARNSSAPSSRFARAEPAAGTNCPSCKPKGSASAAARCCGRGDRKDESSSPPACLLWSTALLLLRFE